MNKKVLKYGAGVFAIVCFVFLVKFIKEELRYNWYTRVFEYPYIVPSLNFKVSSRGSK